MSLWCSLRSYAIPFTRANKPLYELDELLAVFGDGFRGLNKHEQLLSLNILSEPKLRELDVHFYNAARLFLEHRDCYENWGNIQFLVTNDILDYVWIETLRDLEVELESDMSLTYYTDLLNSGIGSRLWWLSRHEIPALMDAKQEINKGRFVYYSPNK